MNVHHFRRFRPMRSLHTAVFLAGAAIPCSGAFGQTSSLPKPAVVAPASVDIVLPGVVSSDGAFGSHWQTDVDITNHDADAQITACFISRDTPGVLGDCQLFPLRQKQGLHVQDVVLNSFGHAGTAGVMTLTTSGDPALVEARLNTYNVIKDPRSPLVNGVAGAGINGILVADLIPFGTVAVVQGAADPAAFRQNLSLFNPTGTAGTVEVSLRDRDNHELGTKTVALDKYTFWQQPLVGDGGLFDATPLPDMLVQLSVTGIEHGGGYLSIADNTSNAPVVNQPFLVTGGRREQFIVSSAFADGANGTQWATDLSVMSLEPSRSANVAVELLRMDQPSYPPSIVRTETFPAYGNRTLGNVVGDFLGQARGTVGALHVRGMDGPLMATTRTFNTVVRDVAGTPTAFGTFGVSIPGLTLSDAAAARSGLSTDQSAPTNLSVGGLTQNDAYRTNAMIVNIGAGNGPDGAGGPTTGVLTAYDLNGATLATMPVSIGPWEMKQFNRVLETMTGGPVENARLVLSLDPNPLPGSAYAPRALFMATVVNNITGQSVARTGFPVVPASTSADYVMQAEIGVWDGSARSFNGSTNDLRLLQIVTGVTKFEPMLGLTKFLNTAPNYSALQKMIDRIKRNFAAADYKAALGVSADDLAPFLKDYDGDGWAIDCGPTDWPYDDGPAPANQALGVQYINLTISRQ